MKHYKKSDNVTKTKGRLFYLIVVAVVLTSSFVACGSDDEYKEDILLNSRVIASGVDEGTFHEESAMGFSKAWVEIEQTWSVRGIITFKEEFSLSYQFTYNSNQIARMQSQDKFSFDVLTATAAFDEDVEIVERENGKIVWCRQNGRVTIKRTDRDFPTSEWLVRCSYEKAIYQDEKLTFELPYIKWDNITVNSFHLISDWRFGLYWENICWYMQYEATVRVQFGNKSCTTPTALFGESLYFE